MGVSAKGVSAVVLDLNLPPPTFGYMCGFSSQGPHGGAFMGVSAMGVSDVATG